MVGASEYSVCLSVRTWVFFRICIKIGVGNLHTADFLKSVVTEVFLVAAQYLKVGHGQIQPLHEAEILFFSKQFTV